MDSQQSHRKQIRHHHDPGHCHELTFSCYQRRPLLTNDLWRSELCQAIDRATERHNWALSAFVLMPEHVHLLVYPLCPEATIDSLLFAIKRPYSYRIKQQLTLARSPLLDKLTVHQRPGVNTFRYWQEGPGYDRNLMSESAVLAAIDYIHLNPVRRGLCKKIDDWKWSSARWYLSEGECVDPYWPRLTRLPGEFFVGRDNVTSW
jgi:putative transposase